MFLCNGSHAVGLKETLVEGSQSVCFTFPQSVLLHHFVALSKICSVNLNTAEGNLAETKNIDERYSYSTIIQFHVHVHCSQE